jgi:hypothetical protein
MMGGPCGGTPRAMPRNVDGDSSRLVLRASISPGLPTVETGERLPGGVADDIAAGYISGGQGAGKRHGRFFHDSCLSIQALEHQGESLAPVDGRVGCPFKNRQNLVPGPPFGAFIRCVGFNTPLSRSTTAGWF